MVAISYVKEIYDPTGLKEQSIAGEGWLKAVSRYCTAPTLYCFSTTQEDYKTFCQTIQPWLTQDRAVSWIPTYQPSLLNHAGVLYRPDSLVSGLAWQRRYRHERGYSICGITHTIASKETMHGIGEWLTAPLYEWDAIICTSATVKTAILKLLAQWRDYLTIYLKGGKLPKSLCNPNYL